MKNLKTKFTKQQLSDHWFIMGTASLECSIELDIPLSGVFIYQQKYKSGNTIEGVYYLVGKEVGEDGKPTTVYFRKDFR